MTTKTKASSPGAALPSRSSLRHSPAAPTDPVADLFDSVEASQEPSLPQQAPSQAESAKSEAVAEPSQVPQVVSHTGSAKSSAARQIKASIRIITPSEAAQLAQKARPGTRVKESAVAGYERAMRDGEWIFNGMPIVFGRSGMLLDGLHRLKACERAEVPFETLVVEDAPDDILHTLDQQRRRSFAGVLSARGVNHPAAVTATLMRLIRYDEGRLRRSSLSVPWARLDRLFEANKDDLVTAVSDSIKHPAKLLPETVRSPLIFMTRRARRARAIEEFLDGIAHPKEHPKDAPGRMVWRRLEEQRGTPYRDPIETTMAICIKAINDIIKGTSSDYYRWVAKDAPGAGRRGEEFPRLWGYKGLTDPDLEDEGGGRARAAGPKPKALRSVGTGATGVQWDVEQISPAEAKAWLDPAINRGNRNIVRDHVEAIARDIKDGRWMLNVQPICFANDGRLLNGQHRLQAVIEANAPSEVLVMRGVPEAAFSTYDLQARRSPEIGDLLPAGTRGASHFGDVTLLNAAATIMWREEVAPMIRAARQGERRKNLRPTASEIRDLIIANPGLLEQRGWARRVPLLMRTSWAMWLAYRIVRDDPKLGPIFLERLESGADLPSGHLILKLRRKLMAYREKKATPVQTRDAVLAAWTEFRKAPGLRD